GPRGRAHHRYLPFHSLAVLIPDRSRATALERVAIRIGRPYLHGDGPARLGVARPHYPRRRAVASEFGSGTARARLRLPWMASAAGANRAQPEAHSVRAVLDFDSYVHSGRSQSRPDRPRCGGAASLLGQFIARAGKSTASDEQSL